MSVFHNVSIHNSFDKISKESQNLIRVLVFLFLGEIYVKELTFLIIRRQNLNEEKVTIYLLNFVFYLVSIIKLDFLSIHP